MDPYYEKLKILTELNLDIKINELKTIIEIKTF